MHVHRVAEIPDDPLGAEAASLYFVRIAPFADYQPDPLSVFMEKVLTVTP